MAAMNLNTGDIVANFEGETALYDAYYFATNTATHQPLIAVAADSKEKVEEVSRVLASRAHLQSLRVELEKRDRRRR
jgi:hypothetical protein